MVADPQPLARHPPIARSLAIERVETAQTTTAQPPFDGTSTSAGVSVTCVGAPPSVGTIHRSVLSPPAGTEEKASRLPSGEKSGKVDPARSG